VTSEALSRVDSGYGSDDLTKKQILIPSAEDADAIWALREVVLRGELAELEREAQARHAPATGRVGGRVHGLVVAQQTLARERSMV